jgi:hypothetical protein
MWQCKSSRGFWTIPSPGKSAGLVLATLALTITQQAVGMYCLFSGERVSVLGTISYPGSSKFLLFLSLKYWTKWGRSRRVILKNHPQHGLTDIYLVIWSMPLESNQAPLSKNCVILSNVLNFLQIYFHSSKTGIVMRTLQRIAKMKWDIIYTKPRVVASMHRVYNTCYSR